MKGLFDQPRLLGLVCAAAAVALGVLYLWAAGAPVLYPVANVAAFLLGCGVWLVAPALAGRSNGVRALMLVFAATLLATTLFAADVNGAARWVRAGPLGLQVSLIVLPAIIVLYARRADAIGTVCILAAAIALAVQPDRAMAGVLVAGTGAIALSRPSRLSALAVVAAILGFGATFLRPDVVPPAPFVEGVVYSAFDVHMLLGLAVVSGCSILLIPSLGAVRDGPDRPVLLSFGASWAALIAASALGNYPTPLLGYGSSSVLGYLLSAAFLARARQSPVGGDGFPPAGVRG